MAENNPRYYNLYPTRERNNQFTLLWLPLIPKGEWVAPFSCLSGLEKISQHDQTSRLLGIDRFLAAVSADTDFPVKLLDDSNSIRNIHAWRQSPYRLSVHLLNQGACGFALGEIPPRWPKVFHTPCCKHTVHRQCWMSEILFLMLHRTALSAMCSLWPGYWVLGWGQKGNLQDQWHQQICVLWCRYHLLCKMQFLSQTPPNAECVTAFSTPMVPFIQTFVGLLIIFLPDEREEIIKSKGGWERITGTPLQYISNDWGVLGGRLQFQIPV